VAGETSIEHLLNNRGKLKFKPFAGLIIGALLDFTVTLALSKPSG
jgi:hypothetical protein